ncbi:winged helix-turn-helix domain-containing protein [Magnetospirillum aberrantis]|uniref:LysR family transcriptional regulator n=1 Tax=Magnetospirillum aberrantis SpK TaxID=908842 RepID=A0A7C9UX88_9PROT|nr:LysR family transcriptional regulator [Magnetospirillum aberrantis]NFV78873.1 LysR family transcriptional regulator [Magnetospirillum aberrantis SpK]
MARDLKIRIRLCAWAALGPGKVALLQAVGRLGSITAAAKDQGMSYRRAWFLLDEMNRALAEPVVEASFGGAKGGGARLTPSGVAVVELYRRIEDKTRAAVADELAALSAMLAPEVEEEAEAQGKEEDEGGCSP